METIIVKNITKTHIFFDDLGIGIDPGSSIDFSELFLLYELKSSMDLALQIKAGNIVLNNGISDLTRTECREFFTL